MRNFCHLLLGWQRFVFAQSSLSRGTFSLEWLLSPIVTGIKNRNNFATTKPPTYSTSWGWCAEWWWHQWMGNRTELSPIISVPSLTKALLHRTMLHSWSIYSYQLTKYVITLVTLMILTSDPMSYMLFKLLMLHYQQQNKFYL